MQEIVDELVRLARAPATAGHAGCYGPTTPDPEAWPLLRELETKLPARAPAHTKASWPSNLLRCLGAMNEHDKAAALIEQWGKSVPSGWASVARGACLGGQTELALSLAAQHPKSKLVAYFALEAALSAGRFRDALELLPRADGRGVLALGRWLCMHEGDSELLWKIASEAPAQADSGATLQLWIETGEHFLARGDRARAEGALAQARSHAEGQRWNDKKREQRLAKLALSLNKSLASLSVKEARGLALAHCQSGDLSGMLRLLGVRRKSAARVELAFDVLRASVDHAGRRETTTATAEAEPMLRLVASLALADSLFETRDPEDARARIEAARALAGELGHKTELRAVTAMIERVASQA